MSNRLSPKLPPRTTPYLNLSAKPRALTYDQNKDSELLAAICHHFNTRRYALAGTWVLTHDYGWSPRQIAIWQHYVVIKKKDLKQAEVNVMHDLIDIENLLETEKRRYKPAIKAYRTYLLFHFLEFEPEHRVKALEQGTMVRKICGDKLFTAIGQVLGWDSHLIVEAGKGGVE